MIEKPIIFSGPMVMALLSGAKTQTRRVIKLPTKGQYVRPDMGGWAPTTIGGGGCFTIAKDGSRTSVPEEPGIWNQTTGYTMAMRWAPGDALWVRETWGCPSADRPGIPNGRKPQAGDRVVYAADPADACQWGQAGHPGIADFCWRPSIHMPRWASRITLAVTGVRVERLQSISEADAMAEGMREPYLGDGDAPYEEIPSMIGPVQQFRNLWNTINGPGAWDANPYVCMIEFRRMEDKQP